MTEQSDIKDNTNYNSKKSFLRGEATMEPPVTTQSNVDQTQSAVEQTLNQTKTSIQSDKDRVSRLGGGGHNRLRSNSKPREMKDHQLISSSPTKDDVEIDEDFDDLIVNKTNSIIVERRNSGGQMKMSELKQVAPTQTTQIDTRVGSGAPGIVSKELRKGGIFLEEEEYSQDPDERDQALDLLKNYMVQQPKPEKEPSQNRPSQQALTADHLKDTKKSPERQAAPWTKDWLNSDSKGEKSQNIEQAQQAKKDL